MIRTHFAALALAVVIGAGLATATAALAAGQISQEALNADRKSCQTACAGKGQTVAKCTSFCDCTVKGIGDQLSLEEYRNLSDAASKQEPVPAPTLNKLKSITGSCRAQIPQ
jgi:hypothetical protein